MGQQALPPGFRFSPTDEELVVYYLRGKSWGQVVQGDTIADVDIYKFEPWDLPEKSALPSKDQEWYFFSAQDKKLSQTARINRTTRKGYWKATGKDRKVHSGSCLVGLKKTLIYYNGRAPNGKRTNWIMHEYRLDEESEKRETIVCPAVLCRIRKKSGPGPRNGEQYGAPVCYEDLESGDSSIEKAKQGGDQGIDRAGLLNMPNEMEDLKPLRGHVGAPKLSDASTTDAFVNKESDTAASSWPVSSNRQVANFDKVFSFGGREDGAFPLVNEIMDLPDENLMLDLSTLPPLPSLSDVDVEGLYDYIFPGLGEEEFNGELWDSVSTSDQSGVRDRALNAQPGVSSLACGDFIELDDIKLPLDGIVLQSPSYSSEVGSPEGQRLFQSQGAATRRVRLQVPVSGFRPEDSYVNYPGTGLDDFTGVSTRSFLSKHVSTYVGSKCEVIPVQACHASLKVVQDEDNCGYQSSTTAPLMKEKSSLDAEASAHSSTSESIHNCRLSDVEAPCDAAKVSSSRQPWKIALREIISRAKSSRLGSRLLSLEGHVRARFDRSVSTLRKPVVGVLPTVQDNPNPYITLKQVIVLSLCHLVVVALVMSCVFWGFRLLREYAVSILV